ncbi:enoyl-CoA hydratase/isomerase family protein [Streptomyces brasiliensis]|uniref:Enoyl-CoA hydratase n=1 Tax=Streptomyces brasiliensis TaxID=1954 RepID=A0A917P998_9ACTN|nr:enoyl-CoA hydratase/isomerase family protein [Streptomyces brasiliensis]GGJ67481.1 enoyl-CoA hydratase [Streptomyces brasiliensis]
MTTVRYERRGAAAWLVLDRPERLNAIDPSVVEGLGAGLTRAAEDPSVRVLVITGAGRAFCAGGDLTALAVLAEGEAERLQRELLAVLAAIEDCPKPVVAAVNGTAVAGGLELVLCCDLVVAVEDARIGDAHATYGLVPGGGATVRLPRRAGAGMARRLLLTGELLPAAELVACGLVTWAVPRDRFEREVDLLAERLAGRSPLAQARVKQLVRDGAEQPQSSALRLEALVADLHSHSHDRAEGTAAFGERRPPRFEGR